MNVLGKRSIRVYLIAVFFGVLLGAAFAEVTARMWLPWHSWLPDVINDQSLRYEAVAFGRHALSKVQGHPCSYSDCSIKYDVNVQGFRGRTVTVPKPTGVIRAGVFGGSAVFDLGAGPGMDWPALLEGHLNSTGSTHFEIVNLGTPGHASFDNFGRLFAEAHEFDLDAAILVNTWNDLKSFGWQDPLLRELRPFAHTNPLMREYASDLDRFMSNSALYTLIRMHLVLGGSEPALEGPNAPKMTRPSSRALRQYEVTARAWIGLCNSLGIKPIFLTEPRLASSENSPEEKQKIALQFVGMSFDQLLQAYGLADSILMTVASETGTPLVDGRQLVSPSLKFFNDHVHLTKDGSEILARSLAQQLRPMLQSR